MLRPLRALPLGVRTATANANPRPDSTYGGSPGCRPSGAGYGQFPPLVHTPIRLIGKIHQYLPGTGMSAYRRAGKAGLRLALQRIIPEFPRRGCPAPDW